MYHMFMTAVLLLLGMHQSAPAQVKFQSKYHEGTTSQERAEVAAHQILTIAGTDVETNSTTSIVTAVEVGRRGADGALQVRRRVTQLKNKTSLPGGIELAFDSANPDQKAPIPQLEPMLDLQRATLKNTTTQVLDGNNQIQSVGVTKEVVDAVPEQLRDQFNPEFLKAAAVQESKRYPSEPVAVGDRWERTEVTNLSGGVTLTQERSFEYAGTVQRDGRTLERIVGTTESVRLEQGGGAAGQPQITKSNLNVEAASLELLFDKNIGDTVVGTESLHITGDLTMSINGMELPGKLDLTLETKTMKSLPAPTQADATTFRTWTDSSGKFRVEASLVAVKDGTVQLKKKSDGSVISVPLSRLSQADRTFLDQR